VGEHLRSLGEDDQELLEVSLSSCFGIEEARRRSSSHAHFVVSVPYLSRNLLAYGIRGGMYVGMAVMIALIWIRIGLDASRINGKSLSPSALLRRADSNLTNLRFTHQIDSLSTSTRSLSSPSVSILPGLDSFLSFRCPLTRLSSSVSVAGIPGCELYSESLPSRV